MSVGAYYLLRERHLDFAKSSLKVGVGVQMLQLFWLDLQDI